MELTNFRNLSPSVWQTHPVEEWSSRLRSVCGNFQSRPCEDVRSVTGDVQHSVAGGLELVQVANDLAKVSRDHHDIRTDYGEHLFLLLQLEGLCGIEQHGRQTIITPGDCILVDSSSPSIFHFDGRFSNHLSVHLPRQILFSEQSSRIDVARRLEADDPMSAMLRALVAKLMKTDAGDKRAPELRKLFFNATRQAFAAEEGRDQPVPTDSAYQRVDIVQILIDRHLTEERLTPQWLANRVGISLRTLQDDFTLLGTTVNSLIRTRRLYYARDQLASLGTGASTTIAEVAYNAGFNDISYFNRCFKKVFDCSPKDMLRQ
ncbi:MAG: helix-turn-helix domain-containing protein [Betaproteobacteria bacterium]